ncbi:MAG: sigma-70 family RNA polymerase sigma factor [Oscillospiraceae bacterium]|nr:sigma-70 family RNA polymerase sigma factor [Oscillospiraceae bacterium]
MEDIMMTELLYNHDEKGLAELKAKYSRLLMKIALGILKSPEDAEECVNDALYDVWNSIPPAKPEKLLPYICRITRRKAIDRLRYNKAAIRNTELLSELDECIPSGCDIQDAAEKAELTAALNAWVKTLPDKHQRLFVYRYFSMYSVSNAAKCSGMSVTAATTALMRMRASLKEYLIKGGFFNEQH